MFHYLDNTLKNLLDSAPPDGADDLFNNAHISFQPPKNDQYHIQGNLAINLFLYEVKENRELRQAAPNKVSRNGQAGNRRAPLRVDCAYMVTAWSKITGEIGVRDSHNLQGQAFYWLSRFPKIPEQFLTAAGLTGLLFDDCSRITQMNVRL